MRTDIRHGDYAARLGAVLEQNGQSPGWNKRFLARLTVLGFKLAPLATGYQLGKHGPVWAPLPMFGEPEQFVYPSAIVNIEDDTDYTDLSTSRSSTP